MNLSARVQLIGALCVAMVVRSPRAAAPPKAKTTISLCTIAPTRHSFEILFGGNSRAGDTSFCFELMQADPRLVLKAQ